MPRFHTALISSLIAIGVAGSALAPGANASINNHAYAKSGEAQKAHLATCSSWEDTLNTAVDKGLAASHTGDKTGQAFYTSVAEISVDQLHKGGCEGW